jgi:hypothetical protein
MPSRSPRDWSLRPRRSATIVHVSWRKLHGYVEEDRHDLRRETVWEWFQWLAERMSEHEKQTPPVPAHIAHKDWKA